jgi:hypothetical protein
MTRGNNLYAARARTCPCGTTFTARSPKATYCSNDCRKHFGRYGRAYGQPAPRQLGVFRPGGAR